MITPLPLIFIIGITVALAWLGPRFPRVVRNVLLVFFGGMIGWCGTALAAVWGIGLLILPIYPLFILPGLALTNPRMHWFATLLLGTLIFTGICGLCIKINLYPHWRQFEDADTALTRLWQGVGFIAASTFVIALIVILICLGVQRLRQQRDS